MKLCERPRDFERLPYEVAKADENWWKSMKTVENSVSAKSPKRPKTTVFGSPYLRIPTALWQI